MGWFRGRSGALTSGAPGAVAAAVGVATAVVSDDESPVMLRRKVGKAVVFLNRNSGELPPMAMVIARELTDVLRETLETAAGKDLDVYVLLTLKGTLTDYLPTTLRSFLAVNENFRQNPVSGTSPADALVQQLTTLLQAAVNILDALRRDDVHALSAQGRFLSDKFTESALAL